MKTETFARRPFLVEAVRITSTNMAEAAGWCKGEIQSELRGNRTVQYIFIDTIANAKSDRQKKAYVGDFLLELKKGFKIYTPKAFGDCFEEPSKELLESLTPSQETLFDLAKKYAPGTA